MHCPQDEVVASSCESLVSDRASGRFALDVFGTPTDLGDHRWQEIIRWVQPVHLNEAAPFAPDLDRVAARCWFDKGPAQLGDVFDAPSRSGLFPIDQSHWDATMDDDIARLQIVMDDTVEAVDQPRREIVQLPNDTGEHDEIDFVS